MTDQEKIEKLRVELSHAYNDLANIKGRVKRETNEAVKFLVDALHASKHEKTWYVTIDHIERALDRLYRIRNEF